MHALVSNSGGSATLDRVAASVRDSVAYRSQFSGLMMIAVVVVVAPSIGDVTSTNSPRAV
jgi:hypothetical protein